MTINRPYNPDVLKNGIAHKVDKLRQEQAKVFPFLNQDLWRITAPLEAVAGGRHGRQKFLFYIFPGKWIAPEMVTALDLDNYERTILDRYIQASYVKKEQQPDAKKRLSFQEHLPAEVRGVVSACDKLLLQVEAAPPSSLPSDHDTPVPTDEQIDAMLSAPGPLMQCGHVANSYDLNSNRLCGTCLDLNLPASKDPARIIA